MEREVSFKTLIELIGEQTIRIKLLSDELNQIMSENVALKNQLKDASEKKNLK